jgi:hypothetical protein
VTFWGIGAQPIIIVTAYIDESGTHQGSKALILAAYIGTSAEWKPAEERFKHPFPLFGPVPSRSPHAFYQHRHSRLHDPQPSRHSPPSPNRLIKFPSYLANVGKLLLIEPRAGCHGLRRCKLVVLRDSASCWRIGKRKPPPLTVVRLTCPTCAHSFEQTVVELVVFGAGAEQFPKSVVVEPPCVVDSGK